MKEHMQIKIFMPALASHPDKSVKKRLAIGTIEIPSLTSGETAHGIFHLCNRRPKNNLIAARTAIRVIDRISALEGGVDNTIPDFLLRQDRRIEFQQSAQLIDTINSLAIKPEGDLPLHKTELVMHIRNIIRQNAHWKIDHRQV